MTRLRRPAAAALLAAMLVAPLPAAAFDPEVLESVVSVLPVWPGHPQGGQPDLPPGLAPEGTAVAIAPGGYLATALHVVDRALSITVRLADGRHLRAEVVGKDGASRSEEHTSELQSLMRISYAVFCLKNKKKTRDHK